MSLSPSINFMLVLFAIVASKVEHARILMAITAVLSLFNAIVGLMLTTYVFNKEMSNDWFKTQEGLEEMVKDCNKSWEKANKFCRIIGNHEAIKMWEENGENQNTNI